MREAGNSCLRLLDIASRVHWRNNLFLRLGAPLDHQQHPAPSRQRRIDGADGYAAASLFTRDEANKRMTVPCWVCDGEHYGDIAAGTDSIAFKPTISPFGKSISYRA